MENLKAYSWIKNFKRLHGIISWKITKFTTYKAVLDKDEIENRGVVFHKDVSELIKTHLLDADQVINSDQCGFKLGARSLSFCCEKVTLAFAKHLNALMHSYTYT